MSSRRLLATLFGIWLSASGAAAKPAPADSGPRPAAKQKREAIELTRRASALNNLGKYQQAVKLFQRAVRLFPKLAGAWRNMGLALEGLKQWKRAIQAYERYLEIVGTGGKYSLKVMERINECRKQLGLKPKIFSLLGEPGQIVLEVNVSGAAIRLDGLLRGSSPVDALPVNAGLHVVSVTKEGYLPFSRSVGVKTGQTVRIRVELKKDPSYKPPRRVRAIKHHKAADEAYLRVDTPAEGVQVLLDGTPLAQNEKGWWVVPKPRGEAVVEVRAPGRHPWRARVRLVRGSRKTLHPILPLESRKRAYRLWGWVSLGLAAVLAGTGGVFGALENKRYEQVRDRRADSRAELQDLRDEGRRYGHVALGLYAAAGAAVVASIVLFIYERRGERPAGRPPPLVVAPTGRGSGLAVTYSGEVGF
jgi:hypothetical protein